VAEGFCQSGQVGVDARGGVHCRRHGAIPT
jgi:hypothetical protein